MSIHLMTLAWRSGAKTGQKMVLLALADNANDQYECYPSIRMIAHKCSMSERAVQGHIADMEEAGIVSREFRPGHSTMYHIDPRRFCAPAESAPRRNLHPTPADAAPPPPQPLHPGGADAAPITISKPSIESSVKQKKGGQAAAEKFDPLAALIAEGVDAQAAADWLVIRKAKRAPLTVTALSETKEQAALANMTLEQAVKICCKRGWQGFEATWVATSTAARGGRTSTFDQSMDGAAAAKQRLFGGGNG